MKIKIYIYTLSFFFFTLSCDDIIEVVDISNETISILAPTNNAVIDTTKVTFSWQTLEDAEKYHIQVATPSFENAIQMVLDTLVSKSNHTEILEPKAYEWRIRGENSDYQTTYTTNSFTVE